MGHIRILPDSIASQIAAGEVIERPAAVVKELLENSLDAGATRLDIEFRAGGRSFICVEDNGRGMSRDDALLCLERHATSKIALAADINRVTTFGFRGEALPSIASISRFLLQTRAADSETGTEILVSGGKFIHARDCGAPTGTRIEVTQLFNSVPARRKFLKTDNTEAAHIVQCARLHAIAHPEVSFRLVENGRAVFQSAACASLLERLGEIFGRGITGQLIEVSARDGDLELSGLIGLPAASRTTRHEMVTFVNRRPVESRTLSYALLESYHEHLPKGRYPLAFLFLRIDPGGVDVNVHPAKREVRFRDESRVRRFVIHAVLEALRRRIGGGDSPQVPKAPVDAGARNPRIVDASFSTQTAPRSPLTPSAPATPVIDSTPRREVAAMPRPILNTAIQSPVERPPTSSLAAVAPPAHSRPAGDSISLGADAAAIRLKWRLIGQARGRLVFFETDAGVVIMDRRAAHERVVYEEILDQFQNGRVARQALLFPVTIELDPVSSAMLLDHLDLLHGYGVEVILFGRNFFRIEGVPAWLEASDAEGLVRDLVGLIREKGLPESHPETTRERIAELASRRAVRASDHLSEDELKILANRLLGCRNPLTSPQGRATFFELSAGEIEKRLFRSG